MIFGVSTASNLSVCQLGSFFSFFMHKMLITGKIPAFIRRYVRLEIGLPAIDTSVFLYGFMIQALTESSKQ